MKNRYYISNMFNTEVWDVIDYRSRQVIFQGSKEECMDILEDLRIRSMDNVDLVKMIKERGN